MHRTSEPWANPTLPRVAFILRVPFDLGLDTEALGARVVVPPEDQTSSASFIVTKAITTRARVSTAVLAYRPQRISSYRRSRISRFWTSVARKLGGRSIRQVEWVVDVEIDNDLQPPLNNTRPVQELVFERALAVLNRYLYAHLLASESASARLLTPQALDAFALVEFRAPRGLVSGPFRFPLPGAHRQPHLPNSGVLLSRLQHNMRAESYGHPVNDVIVWRVRAEHLVNYVGDFELSVVALQTSAERLIFALVCASVVDRGGGRHEVSQVRRGTFDSAFNRLQQELGGNWDRSRDDIPVGPYWKGVYVLRNRIVHAGQRIDLAQAEGAFDDYREFKEFLETQLLAKSQQLPRTALMYFGLQGIVDRGKVRPAVANLVAELDKSGQDWGWWEPP